MKHSLCWCAAGTIVQAEKPRVGGYFSPDLTDGARYEVLDSDNDELHLRPLSGGRSFWALCTYLREVV